MRASTLPLQEISRASVRFPDVITMTGPTKILVASSCAAVSNWNNYKTSGGTTRVYSQTDGERQSRLSRSRGPDAPRPSPARKSEPDRHPCRLRHQPVRRLRRPYRRPGGQILHRAGRPGGRLQRHHHRRHRQGRRTAPDAGGVPRQSRPAVRLLHPGHDHVGDRYCAPPQQQRSTRKPSGRNWKATSAAAPATTTSSNRCSMRPAA